MSGVGSRLPREGAGDDFFEQLLSMPLYGGGIAGAEEGNPGGMLPDHGSGLSGQGASSFFRGGVEYGHTNPEDRGPGSGGDRFLAAARRASFAKTIFDGQSASGSMDVVPHPLAPGPRARAKRGQTTNPHSIAERLRRERIAERMRALQEVVPKCNKTDRAAMLDEIVDYVKFLRLQVKVLSMSRHSGTGASQLAADIPPPLLEGGMSEDGSNCHVWERWSVGGSTEQQVAKLMEEDVGVAMQFLQSNALCIMPISLAASICRMHNQPGSPSTVKTDPGASP